MKIEGNAVLAFIIGDSRADRVVPRIGMTAWLTVFVSAAMAFLAVFALALALTTERVARAWADDLQRAATVRVSAPFGQADTRTASCRADIADDTWYPIGAGPERRRTARLARAVVG